MSKIGIVVAQSFPDTALIVEKLEEGIARAHPDTVWVMRDPERANHAVNAAYAVFREHKITPILAPLLPEWKYRNGCAYEPERGRKRHKLVWTFNDARAKMRDILMRASCNRIVVFHDAKSGITGDWIDYAESRKKHPGDGSHCVAKVYVVERGKKRGKTHRKGKAPIGA